MARKRVVSRTIATTIVTALVTDIVEQKAGYKTITVAGTFKDDKKLDKVVRKMIESESNSIKFNCVVETHVEEALYSMDEARFLELAEKTERRA